MNFSKYSDFIVHIFLTLLLVYDFFPDSFLSNLIPLQLNIWIFSGLFIISIFSKRSHHSDDKVTTKGQILSLIYFISVILTLTYLGGESASGLEMDDIRFWIILAVSIGEIISKTRKKHFQNKGGS